MSVACIAKGVREGWLAPDDDGWHRFVWDYDRDPITGSWVSVPARGTKRVRIARSPP